MDYFVYILYNPKLDRYYTGSTGDLEDRMKRHNQGRSKATKGGAPYWELAYREKFETRSEAVRRENEIKKKKSRKYIEFLKQKL